MGRPSVVVTGVSTLESVVLLAIVAAAMYLYYHGPLVSPAGLGTPLAGPLGGSNTPRSGCGPDCVVCPHCGTENAAAFAYCRRCLGGL